MKPNLKSRSLASAALLLALAVTAPVAAEQKLRVQVDQRGDFAVIGNTLGWDCGANAANPIVGTANTLNCGTIGSTADSSADLFWRSDDPAPGQATASLATTASQARSSAVLKLPAGALVTHAYLYWGARRTTGTADAGVQLDRPGGFGQSVAAVSSYTARVVVPNVLGQLTEQPGIVYQSVADVTALVLANGSGAYRVSGVEVDAFPNANNEVLFAGWSLVVLYQLASEPPRNLAVFDGLDLVAQNTPSNVSLSGFLVPNAGFDAKLGALAYEGDQSWSGDSLRFGGSQLTDGQNPADNFFNGTRSWLGSPVSVAGDLPQLAGTGSTMAGMDLDVVDVTQRVTAGQTRVDLRAESTQDVYYLGAFVTSISTFRPDFISSEKRVKDLNAGYVKDGDELEYTIIVKNTGNDTSVRTVLTDPLPTGVTFVPGSVQITSGANLGPKTDAAGDDQAFYDAASRTLTVYVGSGASAAQGGSIAVGESSAVTFRVKVDAGIKGLISNQGKIDAAGQRGAPPAQTLTDGNADGPGNPPTDIPTGECQNDMQCGGDKPYCDLSKKPATCGECTMDSHCKGPMSRCDLMTNTCVCPGAPGSCIDTDGDGISDPDEGTIGTDPKDADTDDDGVIDGKEQKPGEDSDGDGKKNALDPDSDNDMLRDGTEQGFDCSNPATDLSKQLCTPDGDRGATTADPLNPDTDGGSARDGAEDTNLDGVVNSGERNPTAGNGADDRKVDSDGDGLTDETEDDLGSDPKDADTDDDGVRDGDEDRVADDTDGDGKINVLDPDSDGDGILDGTERGTACDDLATNRAVCVPDADRGKTTTSALDPDTDTGGVPDGEEDKNHDGAIDKGESDPNAPCDDNERLSCDASPVDTGFQSLAGAGGCNLHNQSRTRLAADAWLVLIAGLFWLTRRRQR
jgi:clumping factor A